MCTLEKYENELLNLTLVLDSSQKKHGINKFPSEVASEYRRIVDVSNLSDILNILSMGVGFWSITHYYLKGGAV